MAATGAKTRQAVRRSGGEKGCELGAALEASAVQSQLYGANAVQMGEAHTGQRRQKGRRAQIDMGDGRVP